MEIHIITGSQQNNLLMLHTGFKCHIVRTTQEARQILHFTIRLPELYNFCDITAFYMVANVAHKLNTHCWGIRYIECRDVNRRLGLRTELNRAFKEIEQGSIVIGTCNLGYFSWAANEMKSSQSAERQQPSLNLISCRYYYLFIPEDDISTI